MLFYPFCFICRGQCTQEIARECFVLGGTTLTTIDETIRQQIPEEYCSENQRVQTFYRLQMKREVYYSKLYGRVKKKNSYTVQFIHPSSEDQCFGQIFKFISIEGYGVFAVMKPLSQCSCPSESFGLTEPTLDYTGKIFEVKESNHLLLVPVKSIISKCIFIQFEQLSYVALMNTDLLLD